MMEGESIMTMNYRDVCDSQEYQALKSLANAPVVKVEVTNSMINTAVNAYRAVECDNITYSIPMRAALEAVFNHISHEGKKVSDHIGEPNEKVEKELISDGWVEWKGGECPIGKNVLIQVRLRLDNNQSNHAPREPQYWNWGHRWGDNDIIAYRIISEPEEKKVKWDAPENHFNITGTRLKPKKQTLLEFLYQEDPHWRDREDLPTLEFMNEYLELNKRQSPYGDTDTLTTEEIGEMFREWERE